MDQDPTRLAELALLPPTTGLVFRGLPADGEFLVGMVITAHPVATSRDPRVATENFALNRVFAIVTRKGREVAPTEEHPDEGEVVLLPGTVLTPVGQIRVDGMGATAQILEEVDPGAGRGGGRLGLGSSALPDTVDNLIDKVVRAVMKARKAEAVPLTSPGRFAGPLE